MVAPARKNMNFFLFLTSHCSIFMEGHKWYHCAHFEYWLGRLDNGTGGPSTTISLPLPPTPNDTENSTSTGGHTTKGKGSHTKERFNFEYCSRPHDINAAKFACVESLVATSISDWIRRSP